MLISYKRSQGSVILRVKILNSSVSTGAGLTGLTSASAGLIIAAIADNEASTVAYTQAGSTIETITTLGTYSAPTATKCRFKEVDATNHKGLYEIQLADARYAVTSAKSLLVSISGATNAAETDVCIPLRDLDPYDSVRAGLTALPNAAAAAAGGLWILGSNNTAAITIGNLTMSALACTTLTASGAVAFQSTFIVTGAVTFSSTFATTGTTTFNAFTVTNATTLSGAVSLGSTLTVTGTTTLAALAMTTLTASGAVAFQSTFAVTTSTSLAALSATTVTFSGAVAFQSTFAVTGTTTLAALTTSGTVTFNAFTVSNATTLSGAVSLGSTLTVTGTTTLAALAMTTLTASGAVAFQSTFTVTTSTSLAALSATTVTFSGAVAFQSTFAVTTSTSLAAISATTITASGTTSLAAVTTSGTVTFNAFTISNAFTVSGATTLTGAVTASNAGNNIVGITVSALGTGVITATSIAADAITAAKVADGTIDAATFAAGAINAAAIADGAIDAATFAASAITATVIATDAIGSAQLAATAVTEIQSGLATSSALSSVASDVIAIGVIVTAIKTKTDLINTATFWLGAFATNSGSTYASAVAGSVVKEIATNSGGSTPPTAAQIAAAMFTVNTGETFSGSATNSVVREIVSNVGGSVGPGSIEFTVTITDDMATPLDGAEVWVSTDEGGSNVIAGTLNTNASGQATFLLDAGAYWLWVAHSGYNRDNPTAITVS